MRALNRPCQFLISLSPDYMVSADDVWPDGDAPENPTAEDVVKQMRETGGSVSDVIAEWGLDPTQIEVLSNRDGSSAVFRR